MPDTVDFHGDFIAADARRQQGPCRFGTTALSALSDFVTCQMRQPQRRMTVKKGMMIAAFVVVASPVSAGSLVETGSCKYSGFYGYSHCTTIWTEIPDPVRDPEQERLDRVERQKEIAKWQEFCKPVFKADEYGVRRASYAKPGCEFGRTE
jgi:hypothetical protein